MTVKYQETIIKYLKETMNKIRREIGLKTGTETKLESQ